ncbi:MAG: MBL fold metallo-hydrolase [Cytophagales bacterium]|nr:MBL fold metallo-hydrolase [Cytophaga sp.]
MKIEQFFDSGLAHLSYAIISNGHMAVIDPARDPKPYYDFALLHDATLDIVIETHPHADFVSSHLEMQKKGAYIYVSKLVDAQYPHTSFDDGNEIQLGEIILKALNTPGHSPDSISILLRDENGTDYAVFTGDTLFVGDVGRPDLRENVGNVHAKKEMLAKQLYQSLRDTLMKLSDNTLVYPAHGPGSLCGKSMGTELSSSIGKEKKENYALQPMDESSFVQLLLQNQPFVPKYFPYDVALNRSGAASIKESVAAINLLFSETELESNAIIIDTRPEVLFKSGHLTGAINIQNGGKFETWLGSILSPEEKFYLISEDKTGLDDIIYKAAKIGYEINVKGALVQKIFPEKTFATLDVNEFASHQSNYTIIDIRNSNEVQEGKLFENSINIPLPELRERIKEIPSGKPIVVHCAGGYRSAAGSSIVQNEVTDTVFDLGEDVKKFQTI